MRVIDHTYIPTEIELEMRPDWIDTIGCERLLCKCGKVLTWYELVAKDVDDECIPNS